MHRRAVDAEVGCGFTRRMDLRAHAAVGRLQRAAAQARPVAADRLLEGRRTLRVHAVVDGFGVDAIGEPFQVGPEAGLACKVEREVHAEPGAVGRRVDEAAERRPAREREVAAFGEALIRYVLRCQAVCAACAVCAVYEPRHAARVQPGGVDDDACRQLETTRRRIDLHQRRRTAVHANRDDLRLQPHRAAIAFDIALQREHQAVAVDDARARRHQRRGAVQLGLQRHRLGGTQRLHRHAVRSGGARQLDERRML